MTHISHLGYLSYPRSRLSPLCQLHRSLGSRHRSYLGPSPKVTESSHLNPIQATAIVISPRRPGGGGVNSYSSRSCVWGVTARSILYAIHNGAAGVDPDTLHTRATTARLFTLTPFVSFETMARPRLHHWTDAVLPVTSLPSSYLPFARDRRCVCIVRRCIITPQSDSLPGNQPTLKPTRVARAILAYLP